MRVISMKIKVNALDMLNEREFIKKKVWVRQLSKMAGDSKNYLEGFCYHMSQRISKFSSRNKKLKLQAVDHAWGIRFSLKGNMGLQGANVLSREEP